MLIFFVAGIMCSFIDTIVWGGSLDFLRLFDWLAFDLKDIYLNVGILLILLYELNYYTKSYYKISQQERKATSMWLWIKKACRKLKVIYFSSTMCKKIDRFLIWINNYYLFGSLVTLR